MNPTITGTEGVPRPDWDPSSPEVLRNQRAAYDAMRRRCPVAYSKMLGWSLFRHEDVLQALLDPRTFSNAVSQHLSVPNGMDRPEHTTYRRIIEKYFSPKHMAVFEPVCRGIAIQLIKSLLAQKEADFIPSVALPLAVQGQCAFLGWPSTLHKKLIRWTQRNREATLAQDRKAMSEIALEFEGVVDGLIEARHETQAGPESDLTASLMHEKVWGRLLSNEELSSILRNWTVGEIGSIAASAGILAEFLATHPKIQSRLRNDPTLIPPAIEEILRIHGPLVANRRVTTRPVEIRGRLIPAGARVTLMWVSANRDETVFERPDTFRLDRDPSKNLLWGAGIHVCPGAPLARLEMRVFLEELLARTTQIALDPEKSPTLAVYPSSGFSSLTLRMD